MFIIKDDSQKTKLGLVLSGSGSDATAIIKAWLGGKLDGVE
jgi:hypothetical protein